MSSTQAELADALRDGIAALQNSLVYLEIAEHRAIARDASDATIREASAAVLRHESALEGPRSALASAECEATGAEA